MDPNQFNIMHKEVNSHSRTIKEAMFIHVQDPPQQKPGQVPEAAHMGPPPPGITHSPVQAQQPSNHLFSYITPPLVPLPPYTFLLLPIMVGAHIFFFPMISTHVCPKYPPLLTYNKSYSSAILVSFLHFIC